MMNLSLKQFVPSDICLKCDGCCRYKDANSIWRPKLGRQDIQKLEILKTDSQSLCSDGRLATFPSKGGNHICRFLHVQDNTCRVYVKRPFECLLYPFILSKTKDVIGVYAHLSCPFVGGHQHQAAFDDYAVYLKDLLKQDPMREFLASNRDMFHDYSPQAMELLHVFDL